MGIQAWLDQGAQPWIHSLSLVSAFFFLLLRFLIAPDFKFNFYVQVQQKEKNLFSYSSNRSKTVESDWISWVTCPSLNQSV